MLRRVPTKGRQKIAGVIVRQLQWQTGLGVTSQPKTAEPRHAAQVLVCYRWPVADMPP